MEPHHKNHRKRIFARPKGFDPEVFIIALLAISARLLKKALPIFIACALAFTCINIFSSSLAASHLLQHKPPDWRTVSPADSAFQPVFAASSMHASVGTELNVGNVHASWVAGERDWPTPSSYAWSGGERERPSDLYCIPYPSPFCTPQGVADTAGFSHGVPAGNWRTAIAAGVQRVAATIDWGAQRLRGLGVAAVVRPLQHLQIWLADPRSQVCDPSAHRLLVTVGAASPVLLETGCAHVLAVGSAWVCMLKLIN